MSRTVTIVFAGQPNQKFNTNSTTAYTTDANGQIAGVPVGHDMRDLVGAGGVILGSDVKNLPLTAARNTDGSALAAAASSGKFGASITLGTSFSLVSEAATGATKTDDALFEVEVPQAFADGESLVATVNANYTGSGTNNASTIQVKAYRISNGGVSGANLGGAAQAIGAAATDYNFAITDASLNPGDRIVFEVETVIVESGGVSALTGHVNSLRVG